MYIQYGRVENTNKTLAKHTRVQTFPVGNVCTGDSLNVLENLLAVLNATTIRSAYFLFNDQLFKRTYINLNWALRCSRILQSVQKSGGLNDGLCMQSLSSLVLLVSLKTSW